MKHLFLCLFFAVISTGIFSGCKNTPSDPPHVDPPIVETPKDPRQMTWTVDTLQYTDCEQTLMRDILPFSAKDIFIYGHCSLPYGYVYHFDGKNLAAGRYGCKYSWAYYFQNNKFFKK